MSDHPLLEPALDHHRAGRLDAALPLYELILASEPQNAYVWNLVGALRTAQANYPLAVEHLQTAVKLDPSQAALTTRGVERIWAQAVLKSTLFPSVMQ